MNEAVWWQEGIQNNRACPPSWQLIGGKPMWRTSFGLLIVLFVQTLEQGWVGERGSISKLRAHAGPVVDLAFRDNSKSVISICAEDRSLVKWSFLQSGT